MIAAPLHVLRRAEHFFDRRAQRFGAVDDEQIGSVRGQTVIAQVREQALDRGGTPRIRRGKGMTFHGKVEAVTDKGLTVNGEKVEGWMDAMTMSYPVDKPDVLKKVKVGDTIMATVYKGDTTLHNVMVMPAGKSDNKKSK